MELDCGGASRRGHDTHTTAGRSSTRQFDRYLSSKNSMMSFMRNDNWSLDRTCTALAPAHGNLRC